MDQAPMDSSGASRGSFASYTAGFILSVVLTATAFALVMSNVLSRPNAIAGLVVAAVVQCLVHLHYFLHMNTSSAWRWNLLALAVTLLIMSLFVGGTMWIMYHLHQRLMGT